MIKEIIKIVTLEDIIKDAVLEERRRCEEETFEIVCELESEIERLEYKLASTNVNTFINNETTIHTVNKRLLMK